MQDRGQSENYQTLLSYYKEKADALERQRQAWLSKFDQCASKISEKQQKQQKLRRLKAALSQVDRNIIHHTIAKFDEQLSTLTIDRQNQNLQFEEAEQLIKLRELSEEYPLVVDKCLPCVGSLDGDLIDNQLNLHNKGNAGRYSSVTEGGLKSPNGKSTKNGSRGTFGGKQGKSTNLKQSSSQKFGKGSSSYVKGGIDNNSEQFLASKKQNHKKTLEQVMKLQIIQTQKLNAKQIAIMQQQQKALQQSINKLKRARGQKNNKQKNIIKQFEKKYNQLQKKHKQLAQNYFTLRRNHKQKGNNTSEENKKLKKTFSTLQEKINQAMRVYEKQNKAKQTLIIKKSEDFQEDYKAKMRAKQRNLQALKQNYEKMQQICIDKVRKLQATVQKARYQLQDIQERRRFLVDDLREQLRQLEKRVNEQRIEKAKIDLRLKQKMQNQKQKQEAQKQLKQKQRKQDEKDQLIKIAYQKTGISPKSFKNKSKSKDQQKQRQNQQLRKQKKYEKSGKKENKKKKANNAESSGQDDSLQASDLDNIKKQINQLERKIAKQQQTV